MQSKNILNLSENVNKTYQYFYDSAKAVLTGAVIELKWPMRNEKGLKAVIYAPILRNYIKTTLKLKVREWRT